MRYSLITTDMWLDSEFRKLDPKGKLLYIYLLTNPQSNISGYYRLPLDMVEMETKASDLLTSASHLWKYDSKNEIVLVPNYLKYNKSKSSQQLKALSNAIKNLPNSPLVIDFMYEYSKYCSEDFSIFDEMTIKQVKFQLDYREDYKATIIKSLISYI